MPIFCWTFEANQKKLQVRALLYIKHLLFMLRIVEKKQWQFSTTRRSVFTWYASVAGLQVRREVTWTAADGFEG